MKRRIFRNTFWARGLSRFMGVAVGAFAGALVVGACGSGPSKPELSAPLWIQQPTRTVDGGYIVYVESSDDAQAERAKFKSESAALADLANECTLIPKGVRIEDRFQTRNGGLSQAYAKVAVEFQVCEEAKRATTVEAVRRLANVPMTEQVKRYQDMIGQSEEVLAVADEDEDFDNGERVADVNTPPGDASGGAPRTDVRYFAIRERIFVAKRDVILAPAGAYASASPETQKFNTAVAQQTTAVATYERAHPEIKATRRSWSHYRHALMRPRVPRDGKAVRAPAPPAAAPGGAPPSKRKKRRRAR